MCGHEFSQDASPERVDVQRQSWAISWWYRRLQPGLIPSHQLPTFCEPLGSHPDRQLRWIFGHKNYLIRFRKRPLFGLSHYIMTYSYSDLLDTKDWICMKAWSFQSGCQMAPCASGWDAVTRLLVTGWKWWWIWLGLTGPKNKAFFFFLKLHFFAANW